MAKFEELTFRRIFDYNIVPRYLFEQIPDRQYDVDNIYKWGPLFARNPFNFLYALTDADYVIKGVLWATIDPVMEIIAVNVFSVDKEYQKNGGGLSHQSGPAVKAVVDLLKEQAKKLGLKETILGTTTRPKALEALGWKRFNRTIMQI